MSAGEEKMKRLVTRFTVSLLALVVVLLFLAACGEDSQTGSMPVMCPLTVKAVLGDAVVAEEEIEVDVVSPEGKILEIRPWFGLKANSRYAEAKSRVDRQSVQLVEKRLLNEALGVGRRWENLDLVRINLVESLELFEVEPELPCASLVVTRTLEFVPEYANELGLTDNSWLIVRESGEGDYYLDFSSGGSGAIIFVSREKMKEVLEGKYSKPTFVRARYEAESFDDLVDLTYDSSPIFQYSAVSADGEAWALGLAARAVEINWRLLTPFVWVGAKTGREFATSEFVVDNGELAISEQFARNELPGERATQGSIYRLRR